MRRPASRPRTPIHQVLSQDTVIGLANHTALIRRDGRRLSIADSAAPIRGSGGEIQGVVLVFRDVTEERLAQRERDIAEDASRRAKEEVGTYFQYDTRPDRHS